MIVKFDLMCDRNVGLQLEAAALNQQLARGQRELASLAAAHDRLHESYVLRQVGSEKMRKSTEDMLTETFHACAPSQPCQAQPFLETHHGRLKAMCMLPRPGDQQLVYKSAFTLCFICVPSKGLDNKQLKGFNDTAAASLEVHP